MADQGAGIDIGDHRDLEFFQILVGHLLRAPVGADGRELAHRQTFYIRMRGLVVVRIGAVIADLRVGQDNDLPGIRRIGENFLVAGDGSIKNDFPVAFAFRAMASAAEDSSIFQRKDCLHRNSEEWIL